MEHMPAILGGVAAVIAAVAAVITAWPKPRDSETAAPRREIAAHVDDRPDVRAVDLPESAGRSDDPGEAAAPRVATPQPRADEPVAVDTRTVADADLDWRRAVVSSNRIEVAMRSAPSTDAGVVERITPKDLVHLAGLEDGWWRAMLRDGTMGYVQDEYIELIDD
jgi:hypothetical protein